MWSPGTTRAALGDDALDFVGQRAAVGVAQHHPARAGVVGGARAFERVGRVGLVAVEEMLAVDHRLAAGGDRRFDAVDDAGEVLLQRAAERDVDVIVPRLGDEDDRVGVGGDEGGEAGIVGRRAAGPLGHAESAEAGAAGRLALEEARVDRVGARIAALDIIDAELVEHGGDLPLVLQREIDAGGQRAVAQRRIEEVEAFAGHRRFLNGAPVRSRRPAARGAWSWWCSPAIRRRAGRGCGVGPGIPGARTAAAPCR